MNTKLTLKLNNNVIVQAKHYAELHHSSLSHLVEDYFSKLVRSGKRKRKYTPIVEELSGLISEKDLGDLDYTDYLLKKYA